MGDPNVQRSGDGFFTRFGRAVDAFGKDDKRFAKPTAKEAKVVELKPLPGKYKSSPRRLDRSVVSAPVSDPAASTISQNEAYVASALKLAEDMRALAKDGDHFYNRTTPKDVDAVTNKYKPLLLAASGATPFEKSEVRKQLAGMMVKELYETSTGDNLFWDLSRGHGDIYRCSERYESAPSMPGYKCEDGYRKSCTVGGVTKSSGGSQCKEERGSLDKGGLELKGGTPQ